RTPGSPGTSAFQRPSSSRSLSTLSINSSGSMIIERLFDLIPLVQWPRLGLSARRRARTEARQRLSDREKRLARGIAVAEVDDQQQADKAHVDLHEYSGIVRVVRKRRRPVGGEALADRLPSGAERVHFGCCFSLATCFQNRHCHTILRKRALDRAVKVLAPVGAHAG